MPPPGNAESRRARNQIAAAGLEGARKAKPAAFFSPRFDTLVSVGNLEDDLEAAAPLRRRHRSDHREPRRQAERSTPASRRWAETPSSPRTPRGCASRPDGGAQRKLPPPVLHHPLLQPAPLSQAGRDRRRPRHDARDAGARRGAVRPPAGQGAGPRQGHAELHRQPHRHLRADAHARSWRSRRATPSRRSTWCSGRRPAGPRARCSAPPTSSASTRWCTSPATATTRWPTTSGATCSRSIRCSKKLVAKKWLGGKTEQGFYKKEGDDILQLDLKTLRVRAPAEAALRVDRRDQAASTTSTRSCAGSWAARPTTGRRRWRAR